MTTSSPRVLAVTNMYPTAADPTYGTFVAEQMNAVRDAGADVTVHFIDGRRSTWEYARAFAMVRRLATTGRFDVVHAHYGLTGFVSRVQPCPLVVSYCGDDLNGTADGRGGITWKSRLIRRLSYVAARAATAIICKSERLRNRLPRAIDRERAHVIGNGVDVARFAPGSRAEARRRLGVSPDERLVLFPHSRRQRQVKRFDVAEDAVRVLGERGVAARLWVVNGVSPTAMPDYYRAADCLLLTSETEGSPNVVKEALCCDLPVVTVDVGDVARWVALAPGARLVPRDPPAVATVLADVLSGTHHVDGAAVRVELDSGRVARRILGVYEEAICSSRNQGAR